ncbi:hypothetical protein [Intrasporangium sp.]|nr:hypothetical protein [Intrasporangium sp.]
MAESLWGIATLTPHDADGLGQVHLTGWREADATSCDGTGWSG